VTQIVELLWWCNRIFRFWRKILADMVDKDAQALGQENQLYK